MKKKSDIPEDHRLLWESRLVKVPIITKAFRMTDEIINEAYVDQDGPMTVKMVFILQVIGRQSTVSQGCWIQILNDSHYSDLLRDTAGKTLVSESGVSIWKKGDQRIWINPDDSKPAQG